MNNFIAMAIGMACGTKFYLFAGIFTLFISKYALTLERCFGAAERWWSRDGAEAFS